MSYSFIKKKLKNKTFDLKLTFPDRKGLLSSLTGLFTCYGIKILSGSITTKKNIAVDTFRIELGKALNWKAFEGDLKELCQAAIDDDLEEYYETVKKKMLDYFKENFKQDKKTKLYPITLDIDNKTSKEFTIVNITSQDTPAFLSTLTLALLMIDISIVKMKIKTVKQKANDQIWIVDGDGHKLIEKNRLRMLQWAILMVKQITHYIPQSPDASRYFDAIIALGKDMLEKPDFNEAIVNLKESSSLRQLSKMIGSSPYIWEEFLRFQHEAIYQFIGKDKMLNRCKTKKEMTDELDNVLDSKNTFADCIQALNNYKDIELLRIDLRHLFGNTSYLDEFSSEFSDLAEVIVKKAYDVSYSEAQKNFKKTIGARTKNSQHALFALGKFGGRELGYASDLELMFVYEDVEDSTSKESDKNAEFYRELVLAFTKMIQAKDKGVFEIDLRLRPYGRGGPLAVSEELFKDYFSSQGKARNFERQALIKLYPIAGSKSLIKRILLHRDKFVYGKTPFDYEEALELRGRQKEELVKEGEWNAKFSEGGLLDIEYLVQTLQMIHGERLKTLRETNTIEALSELKKTKILSAKEHSDILATYIFLRDLINAMRIFRGNAIDLTLPQRHQTEYIALSRRMHYVGTDKRVEVNFSKELIFRRKIAKEAYQKHVERIKPKKSRKKDASSKITETDFSDTIFSSINKSNQLFQEYGFRDKASALRRFQFLIPSQKSIQQKFDKVLQANHQNWRKCPDPDMALFYFEKLFERSDDKDMFWTDFIKYPKSFEILLVLFGTSRYLSDILTENINYWDWVRKPDQLTTLKTEYTEDIDNLKKIRHRETLRIALSEIYLKQSIQNTTDRFTQLADYVLGRVFDKCFKHSKMCLLGMGKIGSGELNYSSDVDLMFLADKNVKDKQVSGMIQEFIRTLNEGSLNDFLYRVDLRLRPHGDDGALFMTYADYMHYYQKEADYWEYQALLRMRPICGTKNLQEKFHNDIDNLIYREKWPAKAYKRIREVKLKFEKRTDEMGETYSDIKMGKGGVRDVEFATQILQFQNGFKYPELRGLNTVELINRLSELKLLKEKDGNILNESYNFLRAIEHRLHLFENRQTFRLPDKEIHLSRLAKGIMHYSYRRSVAKELFLKKLNQIRSATREVFEKIFFDSKISK